MLTPLESALNVLHLLFSHVVLAALLWLGLADPYGWDLPVALVLPGLALACMIHQRVISEWMHESVHFNFVRGKKLNDALTNVLAAPFFMESIEFHRTKHFMHHRRGVYFHDEDPDTRLLTIRSRREFLLGLLSDLCGITAIRAITEKPDPSKSRLKAHVRMPSQTRFHLLAGIYHASLIATLILAGPDGLIWSYALYYGSLLTLYPAMNRIRVTCHHTELTAEGTRVGDSEISRTMECGFLDRLLFNSRVMIFHHEHHAHPNVPYRELARMCQRQPDPNRYVTSRWKLLLRIYRGLPTQPLTS